MTQRLAEIWRHPIKGLGRERLESVAVTPEAPLPGDRAWALLHENAAADTDAWQPRRNFLVVASGPRLAQIAATAHTDGTITVTHPDRPDLTFVPATEGARLIDWVRPLWPEARPAPHRLVPAPPQGMADNGAALVSILSRASLAALSDAIGQPLDIRRFRGNLVLDGGSPWEEFDLVGREITLGGLRLKVTERIERCRATEANPETGERDADTLRILQDRWGHRDFGVYATILDGGTLAPGAEVAA
ncbi:MOSC domain-containing protein [Roseivivax sediminis]|uniref:MOSC domain-containing protein n=1 Tax=Roseivivax sediminis TaxID=936889 RepID=A0A1I1UHS7_9RHOB|nr:MOSC domain-containing protein [Roseivivax sediminis]SFD70391.1 hypothetical protein SAMN04515678_102359 [Roseivivax sediminis]